MLPSYPLDLKPLKKETSPNGNRIVTDQNFDEIERYMNQVATHINEQEGTGGVDIEVIIAAVRLGLKKIVTIPVGLGDGLAMVDPDSQLVISRAGNSYKIGIMNADKCVVQVKSKLTNAVAYVGIYKYASEIEIAFDIEITNDFEVVII